MLRSLRVTNFLLLEDALLEPAQSFSVLSGETGTGKSILLRALALLVGGRGSAAWVRRGSRALRVHAIFGRDPRTVALLERAGVPATGKEISITREIDRHGRSRCFINDQRVLVGTLRRVGPLLIEVHGQRQEETFRRSEVQRELLDLYGGHQQLRREVREAFGRVKRAQAALQGHRSRLAKLASDEDWLRFQAAEIAEVDPQPGEIETLRERVRSLRANVEHGALVDLSERLLNGREGAVLESLEELDHALGRNPCDDETWVAFREAVADLRRQARDAYRRLGALRNDAAEGAQELDRLQERLSRLEQLERKHRRSLAEVIALAGELRASLEALEAGHEREAELVAERDSARDGLRAVAAKLTASRAKSGAAFARRAEREIAALGLSDCKLAVTLRPLAHAIAPQRSHDTAEPAQHSAGRVPDDAAQAASELLSESHAVIGPHGAEQVIFTIETNPGEGFRPLGEIASGGEMARIALAIRVVLGAAGSRRLTVFDEIDAGLGGEAAKSVAARLAAVAQHRPVLLVTHLPVIAAAAAKQFRVSKERRGGRNVVKVTEVHGDARVAEIARMLAGDPGDTRAKEHARELLGRQI